MTTNIETARYRYPGSERANNPTPETAMYLDDDGDSVADGGPEQRPPAYPHSTGTGEIPSR